MESTDHPRVVVGVDRSSAGYAALRAAVGVARSRRVPLQAVHAAPTAGMSGREAIDLAFEEALGGVPVDLEVMRTSAVFDSAAGALAANASDPRDLIVIGNDGRRALRALWSGSVVRGVFKRARCQVLIVPTPEMDRATRRSARKLRRQRTDVWNRLETEVPQLRGRPFQGA